MKKGTRGLLTQTGEWCQHLRRWGKLAFWKGERQAGKKLIKKELNNK